MLYRAQLQAMLEPRPERRPSAAALVGGPACTEVRRAIVGRRLRWPWWAAAGALAGRAGNDRSGAHLHRNVALASMGVTIGGGALMYLWKD